VQHCGTDKNDCRFVSPELKELFDQVGISESHLEHRETRDFIYDFIKSYQGMNAVKKEIVPSSVTSTNFQAPKLQTKLEVPPPVPARTIPVSINTLSNNVSIYNMLL
jgi:hypothetical protein